MKIAAIVGSNRKESYNLKLTKFLQKRYANRFELEIVSITELPFYNQDIENTPPESVTQFKAKIKAADAVLWVVPEYNGTVPGIMVNAIDWLSRVDRVMIGKPSWIIGASMGNLGTVKAQAHLRDILFASGVNSPLLPSNEVYVGAVHEKIDAQGNLIHEPTVQFLDSVVNNFIAWYDSFHAAISATK
ncbi:NAD(P)H-dependent oxidoreductase [Cohnella pontilimi]|uniref:NAD(P)H-dependent oxidoreductase n=1 Tax=Cohnella pontilimi TaxID=2564100 RepID=A0A4V5LSC4_9BACL|nr:NAD(P)H-dependent oxidoreductase [Cohnella pontilimi]TJY41749.1 NAD(P)H-dependent oxidoreductase [Cohnella pontilimi]